jgi:hypothetical protein
MAGIKGVGAPHLPLLLLHLLKVTQLVYICKGRTKNMNAKIILQNHLKPLSISYQKLLGTFHCMSVYMYTPYTGVCTNTGKYVYDMFED